MGRPSDADSAATYDSIVAAALEVLGEIGSVDSLSMRKVATRADVSLGTIQYYFDNKAGLLEACLDGYYGRLTTLANELMTLARGGTLEGAALLEHAARELFRWGRRERGLIALRLATNARAGELPKGRQVEFMGALTTQAARTLEPHIEVSELDARLAVQVFSTSLVRFVLLTDSELEHLTGQSGAEARTTAEDFFVTTVRRMLRPGDG